MTFGAMTVFPPFDDAESAQQQMPANTISMTSPFCSKGVSDGFAFFCGSVDAQELGRGPRGRMLKSRVGGYNERPLRIPQRVRRQLATDNGTVKWDQHAARRL